MGNQGSKSEPEETTSVKNKKTTTAKKQKTSKNFNSFVNESTEVTSTETVFNEIYSTIEATQSPTPTPTSVKPGLIPTSTKSKSPTATSTSGSSSRGKGSNGSTNWKLYGGIALAVILVIIILALIVKKMNKKSKKGWTYPELPNIKTTTTKVKWFCNVFWSNLWSFKRKSICYNEL